MDDKKSYLQKMSDQLKQWDTKIDELKANADKTKTESRAEFLNQIKVLRAKKKSVQDELIRLQDTGGDAWDELKTGFDRSWVEFKGAFSNALAKFK
jgi:septal ring factor EnvC (AmiA/AmiB activator)